MRALTNMLLASATVLGTTACLPDFSPDPMKSDVDKTADGAVVDRDASTGGSSKDASGGGAGSDSGGGGGGGGGEDAGTPPSGGEDGGGTTEEPDSGGGPSTGTPPPAGCDLSGKWFVNEHWVTEVIGAEQLANNMFFYEIEQNGTELLVKNSYGCGATLQGLGGIPASTNDEPAWPAYATQPNYGGRKGTVTMTAGGCQVDFERASVIHGATVSAYRDESLPLPKVGQQAMGDTPGWEDWDSDMKPGVTLTLGGLASGELYICSRSITTYDGAIAANPSSFKLHMDWEQERETLGANPNSPILTAAANRVMDETRQFVEFGKMTDAQAGSGSPVEICANARALGPTITPDATSPTGTNP